MDEVLDFIEKRFKTDCNWLNGNCYYFAIILKARFPDGEIVYDVIDGHFLFLYKGYYYDWLGAAVVYNQDTVIPWNKMREYDPLVYERVIRDCIK